MRRFDNSLDNIRIASPCNADWNQMYDDDRKRFCGDCKLNVYDLSDMTRQEAENLLFMSEGRLCVRFFRRADGTVLTKNCPVGWKAVKARSVRIATAAFSVIVGFVSGWLSLWSVDRGISRIGIENVPAIQDDGEELRTLPTVGQLVEVRGEVAHDQGQLTVEYVGARVVPQKRFGSGVKKAFIKRKR